VLVQHRGIQSHKCLRRMPRKAVEIVRLVPLHRLSPNCPLLDSDGPNIREIAQEPLNPPRELTITADWLMLSMPGPEQRISTHRFPNPVPAGTRVPQWALQDITVRSPFALFQNLT